MNHSSHNDEVGDYKISWTYIPADTDYTIMAQQMSVDFGEKKFTSFRQWNPDRLDVPWGEDNGSPVDDIKGGCYCCMICSCVATCFEAIF